MAAAAPRTQADYEWAVYEFDQYGGKRPQPPTVTEQRLWNEARAAAALGSTASVEPPATSPSPAQEPTVANKKPTRARPTPPSATGRAGSYPRVQPGLFGPSPVQPDLMTGPLGASVPPGATQGGDIGRLYAASGNQQVAVLGPRGVAAPAGAAPAAVSYPVALDQPGMVLQRPAIGMAGELPFVERVPSAGAPAGMRAALGLGAPEVPPIVGQGDFFGGGGTVPQPFERDPGNVGQGRFALAPAEQAALWEQLDPRTQGLKRVLGGGMTSAIPTVSVPTQVPAAPQATPAPPPHDPRAYSNRPMTISRPAAPVGVSAVGAGNLALSGVMAGVGMRDALPANMDPNLADLNMAGGAPIGIEARTTFDTPEEVKYMRALGADRQAREVGGGRGTAPARAYPVAPRSSGVAPVAQVFSSSPDGTQFGGQLDGGWVQNGLPARPVARQVVRPAAQQVMRPAARLVARPGPWSPMAVDPSILMQTPVSRTALPVGNANIDDETRRRAYRALGMLP